MKIKLNGVPATPEQIAALVADLGLDGVEALAQQAAQDATAASGAAASAQQTATAALAAANREISSIDVADFIAAAKAAVAPELVEARDRAGHTGTQPASTIRDFTAAVLAVLQANVQAGSGISLAVVNGRLVISATGGGQPAGEGIYISRDYISADYIQ